MQPNLPRRAFGAAVPTTPALVGRASAQSITWWSRNTAAAGVSGMNPDGTLIRPGLGAPLTR